MKTHAPCLILNQDYTPITIVSWKRAICQQIIGKEMIGEGINVIEYYKDDYITSSNSETFPVAAVAVTNRYIKLTRKVVLSKKNLMIRDNSTCQYCSKKISGKNATIDHIIPKSSFTNKSDSNKWENLVICCHSCNNKKRNRTPQQAGMKLISEAKCPSFATIFFIDIKKNYKIPKEWGIYL
tara:strand:- start:3824 stop:4369 length:546 start_codon:yes stop_codon:yes gene_type:complete